MSISAYKEITEWDNSEFVVPNHTYLFDGKSNILAYAKASNDELVILHKPLAMDTRRRKFIKVKHEALDSYGATVVLDVPNLENTPHWSVKSDSGKTYTVTLESGRYTCNCIGFAYRNSCKHSKQVQEMNEKIKQHFGVEELQQTIDFETQDPETAKGTKVEHFGVEE